LIKKKKKRKRDYYPKKRCKKETKVVEPADCFKKTRRKKRALTRDGRNTETEFSRGGGENEIRGKRESE